MIQQTITLISGIVGSSVITSVATAYVSDFLSRRKEKHALKRERLDDLGKLFEDTLCLLEKGKRDRCRGDASFEEQIIRMNARLELHAPPEILEQFDKAGSALQEWSEVTRKAEPKPIHGGLLYRSGADKFQPESDRLAVPMHEEMEKLKQMMRDQIARMRTENG